MKVRKKTQKKERKNNINCSIDLHPPKMLHTDIEVTDLQKNEPLIWRTSHLCQKS